MRVRSHADLVEMTQEIGPVVVDAVRSSALELFPAVAAREETHAERAGAPRSQEVPHTVPDNNRVGHINTKSIAGSDKKVRIGLSMLDLISRNHRHTCRVDTYCLQGGACSCHSTARRHCPRHLAFSQILEQLLGAWQRPNLRRPAAKGVGMSALDLLH
jgi:hypothetical protein